MPTSWREGEEPSTHMQVECSVHGVIGLGPKSLVMELIAEHALARHKTDTEEYKIIPAPYRCDLCGDIAEPPWWTHVTVRPLHEIGDADGQWLVCDDCSRLVQVGDAEGLITRSMDSHKRQSKLTFTKTGVAKVINRFLAESLAASIELHWPTTVTVDYHRGMD